MRLRLSGDSEDDDANISFVVKDQDRFDEAKVFFIRDILNGSVSEGTYNFGETTIAEVRNVSLSYSNENDIVETPTSDTLKFLDSTHEMLSLNIDTHKFDPPFEFDRADFNFDIINENNGLVNLNVLDNPIKGNNADFTIRFRVNDENMYASISLDTNSNDPGDALQHNLGTLVTGLLNQTLSEGVISLNDVEYNIRNINYDNDFNNNSFTATNIFNEVLISPRGRIDDFSINFRNDDFTYNIFGHGRFEDEITSTTSNVISANVNDIEDLNANLTSSTTINTKKIDLSITRIPYSIYNHEFTAQAIIAFNENLETNIDTVISENKANILKDIINNQLSSNEIYNVVSFDQGTIPNNFDASLDSNNSNVLLVKPSNIRDEDQYNLDFQLSNYDLLPE